MSRASVTALTLAVLLGITSLVTLAAGYEPATVVLVLSAVLCLVASRLPRFS